MQTFDLPKDLPAPVDDGACDHLVGLALPSLDLPSTKNRTVNLARLSGWVVVYCYPMTGQPGKALPTGWVQIPGAAGCTSQSCSFRDHYSEIRTHDAHVFGLSTQTTQYQREAAERLHLPFELLSDSGFLFSQSLRLPMLDVEGMNLTKRVTLIARDGRIAKHFYPVFPPDRDAGQVLSWLRGYGP